MTDHEQICLAADSEDNEPFFLRGMLGIVNDKRRSIVEDGLCFRKGDAVFAKVDFVFMRIPFKVQFVHNYIIITRA